MKIPVPGYRSELGGQTKEYPGGCNEKGLSAMARQRGSTGAFGKSTSASLAPCRSDKIRQKDKTEGGVKKARHRAQANMRFLGSPSVFWTMMLV